MVLAKPRPKCATVTTSFISRKAANLIDSKIIEKFADQIEIKGSRQRLMISIAQLCEVLSEINTFEVEPSDIRLIPNGNFMEYASGSEYMFDAFSAYSISSSQDGG